MARAKKTRRDTLGSLERLEERQLMTASPTAVLSGGLLKVTGTAFAETVNITTSRDGRTLTADRGPGLPIIGRWDVNQVRSIEASMGAGNDRFTIDFGNRGNELVSVKVDMGRGSGQEVRVYQAVVGNVDVDMRQTINGIVRINGTTVTSRAFADFGSGNDGLYLEGSTIAQLVARMKDGDDKVDLRSTAVSEADVNLGGGKDGFATNSTIGVGTIDGGAGSGDYLRGVRSPRVRYLNFEDVRR